MKHKSVWIKHLVIVREHQFHEFILLCFCLSIGVNHSSVLFSTVTQNSLSLFLLSQEVHLAQASFQLQAFGTQFILDLTLNK